MSDRLLGLVGFIQGDADSKPCFAVAASKLHDIPFDADVSDVNRFLMLDRARFQIHGGALFGCFRISENARNLFDGKPMAGLAIDARDSDFIRKRQHFETERQGVNRKTLLQECAAFVDVGH